MIVAVHIVRGYGKVTYFRVETPSVSGLDDMIKEGFGDFAKKEWRDEQGRVCGAKYFVGEGLGILERLEKRNGVELWQRY